MSITLIFFFYSKLAVPKGDPPVFVSKLWPVEATEGDECTLSCKVSGTPQPNIEWMKNNVPLPHDGRARASYDGRVCTLSFPEVKTNDSGTYTCNVSNDFGKASSSAALNVNERISKPVILEKMDDKNAYENENSSFSVKLSSHPKAKVEWYRGPSKLTDGGRYRILESDQCYTLKISDLKLEDSGTYKFVAHNEGGKVVQRAELTVKEKETAPEFDEGDIGPFTIMEDKELSVNLTVRGKPKPEVSWYKDERKLTPTRVLDMRSRGNTNVLEIFRATGDHEGSYKCEAKNKLGKATKTFEVRIKGNNLVFNVLYLSLILVLTYFFSSIQLPRLLMKCHRLQIN